MRRRRASEQEQEGGGGGGGPRASGMATSSIEGQSGARGHPGPDSEISESEEEDELVVLGEEEELDEERLLKMSKLMRFENEVFKKDASVTDHLPYLQGHPRMTVVIPPRS